ncbi:MAG: hypothetical protein ACR2PX_13490 [Endozoicomonas sp.]|uniref:hypothetical protein n=1 Tax=Endozoicomonas sp. TaxID=1892382 RepID=UPI003D9B6273
MNCFRGPFFKGFFILSMVLGLSRWSVAENTETNPFTALETRIEQQAPNWWPVYQVVQTAIQDQRVEDARLLLDSLLNDHAEDESAFQLLGPRALWLTPFPDCAVLNALSETPAPWLSGFQRFCDYLTERRQVLDEVGSSTWYSGLQWLFGIKTRQAVLTEQALTDLETFQTQQPDSLLLAGLTHVLRHLNHTPQWRREQFWQDWQAEHPEVDIAPYRWLWEALSRQWLPTAVSQQRKGAFLMPGAEGQPAYRDANGLWTIPVTCGCPGRCCPGQGHSGSGYRLSVKPRTLSAGV